MSLTFLRAHRDLARQVDQLHRDYAALAEKDAHKAELIESLRDELAQARADCNLVALCVPRERRPYALEFVRAKHWIDGLDEVDE